MVVVHRPSVPRSGRRGIDSGQGAGRNRQPTSCQQMRIGGMDRPRVNAATAEAARTSGGVNDLIRSAVAELELSDRRQIQRLFRSHAPLSVLDDFFSDDISGGILAPGLDLYPKIVADLFERGRHDLDRLRVECLSGQVWGNWHNTPPPLEVGRIGA